MKKQNKPVNRDAGPTKGILVRLKKTTIRHIESKLDEDTPTVPKRIRKTLEEEEMAEHLKRSGG